MSDSYTVRIGCAVFATFFLHFETNLNEYGFEFDAKQYMLQRIFTYDFFIRLEAIIHIQDNIRLQILAYKGKFACKYLHTSEYLLRIASNYLESL